MNMKTNGEEDEDCAFLENVLDKLYDFGNGPAAKKKSKSQKKQKRKRCEEEEEEEEEDVPAVQETCSDSEDNRTDRVCAENQQQQTKTQQAGRTAPQVEVVTFQDPKKKPKQTPVPEKQPALQITEEKESSQPEELNLEKARLEVHRFGITGYKKEQQRGFEQDRAVMLGARPPKKDYVNYKVLQQQIKEKKQKVKEDVQPDLKKKKKHSNQRDKSKKVSSGSGTAPSGQVGRFKNGMLVLSSKEIQKIKGNKRRK
ncbi:uncharacterized protein C1orf131 homolog [Labrus mixtus]|uniref:uncharacterized protein C1orf131 homolog n=1 Tax=Labrus mixtus TaxID=508554 RepID=UPI0029C0198C|nr:uncharacterized protein C1orf131 homolog [Labrus mixtus]